LSRGVALENDSLPRTNFRQIVRRQSTPNPCRRALLILAVSPRAGRGAKCRQNVGKNRGKSNIFFVAGESRWRPPRPVLRGVQRTTGQCAGEFGNASLQSDPAQFWNCRVAGCPIIVFRSTCWGRHASTMCWAGLRRASCRYTQIVLTAIKCSRQVFRALYWRKIPSSSASIQSNSSANLSPLIPSG